MTLKDDTSLSATALAEDLRDPLMQRQFELENAAIADRLQAIHSYEDHLADGEQLSRSSSSRRLLREILAPATKAVRDGIAEALQTGRPGRHNAACRLLANVSPEAATMTTLTVLLDGARQERSFQTLAKHIGHRVFAEEQIVAYAAAHPRTAKYLSEHFKTDDAKHQYRYLRAMLARLGVELEEHSWADQYSCGAWLLGVFTQSSGLFERVRVGGSRDSSETVLPTERLLAWITASNKVLSEINPIWPPLLVPPKDWSTAADGGYHFALAHSASFVVAVGNKRSAEIRRAAGHSVLAAVNHLQATRWRINKDVLGVFRTVVETGGNLGGIASLEPAKFPPHPIGDRKPQEAWTEEDLAQVSKWKWITRSIHLANWNARRKALREFKALSFAEKFAAEPAFHFTVYCDFRGRVYYRGSGINPQGPDRQRAMLEFADGKILTEAGRRALALHGIGRLGKFPFTGEALDKLPIADRLAWITRMEPSIIAAADFPMRDIWWSRADDPWQFLAFCFAWRDQHLGKPVHLPVQIDGTCNGYQHIAAMARDEVLGADVNLTNPAGSRPRPRDLYLQVASDANAVLHVKKDLAVLGELEHVPNLLTRSVVKGPVMAAPYGATLIGMADSIEKSLKASGKVREDADIRRGCIAIAGAIRKATAARYPAAEAAQQFILNLSAYTATAGLDLAWRTPSGFPVSQQYRKQKTKVMNVTLPGRIQMQHTLVVPEDGDKDRRRARASAAPNVVQSLDAAHMHTTASLAAYLGMEMGGIHDCILHHANDAELMAQEVRRAFMKVHLKPFLEDLAQQIPGSPLAAPPRGQLAIAEVFANPFFFS